MKKVFGEINLNWLKVIIMAIVIGVSIGLINCVPKLLDTSFRDPAIYFGFWILWGIFIIMNSKSNLDSALKCFVFFLISQPLIYLVEVPFVRQGWGIFVYYKYWFFWTIACLPMGFIGYYMKKNKWWGLIILLPMMGLLALDANTFIGGMIYSFPHHLLSYLFDISLLIILPLAIFKDNKKVKYVGLGIGVILIVLATIFALLNRTVYETEVLCNNEEHPFNETYKVYLSDESLGKVEIKKIDGLNDYCVHSVFVKTGKTELTLEDSEGNKDVYDLEVKKYTYDIEKKN